MPARPSPPLLPTSPLFFLFPVIFLEILLLAAPTSRTAGLASPFPGQEEGAILGPWGQRLLRILWEGHWGNGRLWGSCSRPSPPCGCSVHGVCGFPPVGELPLFLTAALSPPSTSPVLPLVGLGLCCLDLSPSWQVLGEGGLTCS